MDNLQKITELLTAIAIFISILAYLCAKLNNLLYMMKGKSFRQKIILIIKTIMKSSMWLIDFLEDEKNKNYRNLEKDLKKKIDEDAKSLNKPL